MNAFPRNLLPVLALFVVLLCFAEPACGQKDTEQSDNSWVTEVKPGIKRYGLASEFAEVGQTQSFAISPDGETIAFTGHQKIMFWDLTAKKVREEVKITGWANLLEYSADGLSLYAVTQEQNNSVVSIFDGVTGQLVKKISPADSIEDDDNLSMNTYGPDGKLAVVKHFYAQKLAVAPDNDKVAVSNGQFMMVFDTKSGEKISSYSQQQYSQTLAFANDGELLIGSDGKIMDVRTGEESEDFSDKPLGHYFSYVSTHPKQNMVAAASWNSAVVLYDFDKKRKVDLESPDSGQQYLLAFSGNGKLLAAVSRSNANASTTKPQLIVWDLESRKIKHKIEIPGGHLMRMEFSADNKSIYIKKNGQPTISKWDLDGEQEQQVRGHNSPVHRLQFSSDNETITTLSTQGICLIQDLESGEPIDTIGCVNPTHIARTRNDQYTVVAANYQTMAIYNAKNKKSQTATVRAYKPPSMVSRFSQMLSGKPSHQNWENFAISDICLSDDDKHVLVALRGQRSFRFEKIELQTGKSKKQKRFKTKDYWDAPKPKTNAAGISYSHSQMQWQPKTLTITPDRQFMAIVNDKKELFVIDAESETTVHELGTLESHNPKIVFTPDSSKLMLIGKKIRFWDVESGEEVEGEFNDGEFRLFDINRDGNRMVAMAIRAREAKVFDLETGKELFSESVDFDVRGVGISNDGKKIALSRPNCQFEVWDIDELVQ